MGLTARLDGRQLVIEQDDVEGLTDSEVEFVLNGPPGGRHLLWDSASRLRLGDLPDGEYELKRRVYRDDGTTHTTAHFVVPQQPAPEPVAEEPKPKKAAKKKAAKK
jgi:hypothetical protein